MTTSLGIRGRLCTDIPDLNIIDTSWAREPLLFSLYPNPTQGGLTIRFNHGFYEAVRVQILTLTGMVLYDKEFRLVPGEIRIDQLSLETGMYIVRIDALDTFRSKQLLIIK
jgi:hypothetical protein